MKPHEAWHVEEPEKHLRSPDLAERDELFFKERLTAVNPRISRSSSMNLQSLTKLGLQVELQDAVGSGPPRC